MPATYTTAKLIGLLQSLQMPVEFLLQTFFPTIVTEESEEIHVDIEKDGMKLAPFVLPTVEGAVMTEAGYETQVILPAYMKLKTPLTPGRALKRVMGEKLLGELSPQDRMLALMDKQFFEHLKAIRRRKEWMAAKALTAGQITVSGEKHPTVVVNFQRDAALTVTLGSGSKWTDSGVKPLANLQTWAELVFDKSGVESTTVVMDTAAWNVFKEDATVVKRLEVQRTLAAAPSLSQDAQKENGARRMGSIDGFDIWVYRGTYKDDANAVQKMLPTGTVLLGGDIQGIQHHGAIENEKAGLQALPYFPSTWVDNDPPLRTVMTESSFIVVPTRVNGSMCASVL